MASRISRRFLSTTARRFQEHQKAELKKESRRNPEILVRHNASAHPSTFMPGQNNEPGREIANVVCQIVDSRWCYGLRSWWSWLLPWYGDQLMLR